MTCSSPGAWFGVTPRWGSPAPRRVHSTLSLLHMLHVWTCGLPLRACPSQPRWARSWVSSWRPQEAERARAWGPRPLLLPADGSVPKCVGTRQPHPGSEHRGLECPQKASGPGWAGHGLRGLSPFCRCRWTAGDTGGSWVRCTVVVMGTGERA